jgi:hypothetical protein
MQIADVNPDFNLAFNSQMTWKGLSITRSRELGEGRRDLQLHAAVADLRPPRPGIDQRGKPEAEKKPVTYYSAFYNNFDPNVTSSRTARTCACANSR